MHRFPVRLAALSALALVVGAFTYGPLTIGKTTSIQIEGTSNVHGWTCQVGQFAGAADLDAQQRLQGGRLTLPVNGIDCGNGTMDNNLQKALDAKTHPLIKFSLTSAETGAAGADGWAPVQLAGALTVAGKTRTVKTEARMRQEGGGLRISGRVPLRMTDFGVKPPTAMLGAMKTGDAVTVQFNAVLVP